MIRYLGIAAILRLFSLTPQTKKIYRFLGNSVGARRRITAGLPASYQDRARLILSLFERYYFAQQDKRFLELGTGWVHWESTVLRLFYNAKFILFDVWDNRQFQAFKSYFSEFRDVFNSEIKIFPEKHEHARRLLETFLSVNSFEEVYNLLGFKYVLEPTGRLQNFEDEAFDACFSHGVFEHIDKTIVSVYIKDLYRLLRPGGYSFQLINTSDHLAAYDGSVCRKNYLKYSDLVWDLFFENDVQYFNRIQRGEWLNLFSQAGFELLEENSILYPIHTKINKKYEKLDRKDIECTTLEIVHRKPLKTV